MTAFIAFGATGIAMASLVGYAFWIKIRVLNLRADLLRLAVELRQAAIDLELTDDPAYKKALAIVAGAAGNFCEMISLPTFVYLSIVRKQRKELHTGFPSSENPRLQAALERCKNDFGSRISRYILIETGAGLAALILVFGLVFVFIPSKIVWSYLQDVAFKTAASLWQPTPCR